MLLFYGVEVAIHYVYLEITLAIIMFLFHRKMYKTCKR